MRFWTLIGSNFLRVVLILIKSQELLKFKDELPNGLDLEMRVKKAEDYLSAVVSNTKLSYF